MYDSGPETLRLPRILCLHGAGTNAEIFYLQMRALIPKLAPHFRLVFVNGPFVNDMHPDMYPVYSDFGPFRSWGRWLANQKDVSPEETIARNEAALVDAMAQDQGSGAWVGILGFSMGAMLACSILLENQRRRSAGISPFAGVDFEFGVIIAARAPAYALSDATMNDPRWRRPSDVTTVVEPVDSIAEQGIIDKLRTPTLHVHGSLDPGLISHRELYRDWCSTQDSTLIEWEGGHRIPIKTWDVEAMVNGIIAQAKVGLIFNGRGM